MNHQEELDQLINDFEANYWAFVYRGGLDTMSVIDEDYERDYRLTVHCIHSKPRQSCPACQKHIPVYIPGI